MSKNTYLIWAVIAMMMGTSANYSMVETSQNQGSRSHGGGAFIGGYSTGGHK